MASSDQVVPPVSFEKPRYQRVLIKLSGEALMGPDEFGIHPETLRKIGVEIRNVHQVGVEVAIVVGGGNMIRGVTISQMGFDRATGDYMGMLATVINSLALQDALEKEGIFTRVQSAIHMAEVAEPFIRRRAIRHLEKKRVVIFAAGTGSPFFSTDTAAALRAMEIRADALFKATKVKGVYDSDPEQNPKAHFFKNLTYREVIEKNLRVMDLTAISLCRENRMPILVFNLRTQGNIKRAVMGHEVGTIISESSK